MPIFSKGVCLSIALLGVSSLFAATVVGTQMLGRDNTGKPIPRFSNGYTIFYDRDQQAIVVYDSAGVIRTQSTLSLPDAIKIVINDVSANRQGTIAVSATAVGRDDHSAFVVVWIKADGQIERVVRTNPFAPRKIAFDGRGHLWAFGVLQDDQRRPVVEHDTLREYDAQGILLQSTLPTSQFGGCSLHPASRSVLLASSDNSLGIYSQACQAYIEITESGELVGRWRLPSIGKLKAVFHGGLSSTGTFYLGGFENGSGSSPGRAVVYRLDKASGNLIPIELPGGAGSTTMLTLLGLENEDLVFYGKPSSLVRIRLD